MNLTDLIYQVQNQLYGTIVGTNLTTVNSSAHNGALTLND